MRTSTFAAFAIAAVVGFSFAACNCGGPPGGPDGGDGGEILTDAGCLAQGSTCSAGGTACCNGATCDQGVCGAPACRSPGQSCANAGDCCGGNQCINSVCSVSTCKAVGTACGAASECCTGICNTTCQQIPGQSGTCKVLGEACVQGGDCCSRNCQGGACAPSFSCRAYDDICSSNTDCCSLLCQIATGQTVGFCVKPTGAGGCTGSGNPCTTGGECCTQTCVNLGSGAPVCQPTIGCRVQGDTCAGAGACCGNTSQCTTNSKCDNGQACRAAGMMCGKPTVLLPDGGLGGCVLIPGTTQCYTVISETNCCESNKVGGDEYFCRMDQGGIPRCFGGASGSCPFGYTGVAPCCIAEGNYCDFRDQCCDGRLCATGADGGRQCIGGTCKTAGTSCTQGTECCTGLQCLPTSEVGNACQVPRPPTDGGTIPDAGTCSANGAGCSSPGQCCSNICNATGTCGAQSQCQPSGAACSANGDCCQGLTCNLQPGSTSGTCATPAGDAGSCSGIGQTCTGLGQCCTGLTCLDPARAPCNGTTTCACEVVIN